MTAATGPAPRVAVRLLRFVYEAHPPAVYLLMSALWSLSVISLLSGLAGEWVFRPEDLLVGLVFFLVLLFLRAVDEVKDLEYDQVHNPGRPLVRGAVSLAEVWFTASVAAVLAISLSALLAPVLAGFVAVNLGYGLGLLLLERWSATFRGGIILNLLVTFPVSAALNLYVCLYLAGQGALPEPWLATVVVVAHVLAFLHLEFGRKLRWPQHEDPGSNGYVQVLGVTGTVGVCMTLGVAACFLATLAHILAGAGWLPSLLPWLSLVATVAGLRAFQGARQRHRELKPFFGGFLMSFFALNILVALLGH